MDTERISPSEASSVLGLTDSQAEVLERQGLVNRDTVNATKSVRQILTEHAFTLFNGVNVTLTILVWTTGQLKNLLFIGIVLVNLVIGVHQELKAKRTLDKLAILTVRKVDVMRSGQLVQLYPDELVLGDVFRLHTGQQIPCDAQVVQGGCRVNESLLTGESVSIPKEAGDKLLSGSYLVSGSIYAKILAVGSDSYAAKLTYQARQAKKDSSEIMATLNLIIKYATLVLIPLGLILFFRSYATSHQYDRSALSAIAAVVGMIPQGLVLLTSSVMAIASMRLARKKTLVQDPYCMENLARTDILCLDKTGTITTGDMTVDQVVAADAGFPAAAEDGRTPADAHRNRQERLDEALRCLATVARASEDDLNDTSTALLSYVKANKLEGEAVSRFIAFSSETKYSGAITRTGRCYVMGAGQYVLADDFQTYARRIHEFPAYQRVLVLASCEGFDDQGRMIGSAKCLGFVTLEDQIRTSAAETFRFFREQGVDIKIISGDDPHTVEAIARQAGFTAEASCFDMSGVTDERDIKRIVETHSVFGRVVPEQKRALIRALHEAGHYVAMTGDGVNDVLAFKEAQVAVAMEAGSQAATGAADLVLMDNDFAHMKEAVFEGRRSINNLQRSAALFLVKTVFSAALAAICILWPPYPFIPIQLSLISGLFIGYPSFVLALEPNHERVRGRFLKSVLVQSMPASLAVTVGVTVCVVLRASGWLDFAETSTLSAFVFAGVNFALILAISRPLTFLRKSLAVSILAGFVASCIWLGGFFELVMLPGGRGVAAVAITLGSICTFLAVYRWSLMHFATE